jgi:hypothetical protein
MVERKPEVRIDTGRSSEKCNRDRQCFLQCGGGGGDNSDKTYNFDEFPDKKITHFVSFLPFMGGGGYSPIV